MKKFPKLLHVTYEDDGTYEDDEVLVVLDSGVFDVQDAFRSKARKP